MPFIMNNPYAMGTQNPANLNPGSMGIMRGIGAMPQPAPNAPVPNIAVPVPGGVQSLQDALGAQGNMDPQARMRLMQMMQGGGGQIGGSGGMPYGFPGRFF